MLAGTAARADELVVPAVVYPRLAAAARSIEGFVPKGWRIEARAEGDLNGDGLADVAFVLREQDPRNVLANDGGIGPHPFNTNPHLLAVAFARRGGGYELALQNHRLISRPAEPTLEDVMEEGGVEISNRALRVRLYSFANAGSWAAGSIVHAFRYRQGRFVLVGYDAHMINRSIGQTSDLSIDYLTRRAKLSDGRIDTDRATVRWVTLPPEPLQDIDRVGDGVEFDPNVAGRDG